MRIILNNYGTAQWMAFGVCFLGTILVINILTDSYLQRFSSSDEYTATPACLSQIIPVYIIDKFQPVRRPETATPEKRASR